MTSDRSGLSGRPVGKAPPGFVPDNERRASERTRWEVGVKRRGRVLTVTMKAPTETIAALSEADLLAGIRRYVTGRGGTWEGGD